MDLHEFTNRLKVLRSIDADEFYDAVGAEGANWHLFREDPWGFVCMTNDETAAKLWALVESRCKPALPERSPETPQGYDALLEPGALAYAVGQQDAPSARSTAISLKRIADALTGNDPGVLDIFQDAGAEFRKGWER